MSCHSCSCPVYEGLAKKHGVYFIATLCRCSCVRMSVETWTDADAAHDAHMAGTWTRL